jgi:hypothetical protein
VHDILFDFTSDNKVWEKVSFQRHQKNEEENHKLPGNFTLTTGNMEQSGEPVDIIPGTGPDPGE